MASEQGQASAVRKDNADGTVGKSLQVLDIISSFGRPVRFVEVLEQSPYPKATLYRLIQTLTNQHMLAFDEDRHTYTPGVRLVRLAHAAWKQASLAPIAREYLNALSMETGETVHLAQLDAAQVLYVDKRNAQKPIGMYSEAGKIGPAYCTGVGKAMMAFLPEPELGRVLSQQSYHKFTEFTLDSEDRLRAELREIAARGYAFDREEHEPQIICIAVPILSDRGRMLGALSVTSSKIRTTLEELESLAPKLQDTARKISNEASSWNFPDHL